MFDLDLQLYTPLNIHIALVGIEVWTETNKIEVTQDAERTMNNFMDYRRKHINPHHKNDNAQLITSVHAHFCLRNHIAAECVTKFGTFYKLDWRISGKSWHDPSTL